MRRFWMAVALSIATLVPALANGGDVAAGRRMAVSMCAHCHAIDGEGPSPARDAPAFNTLARKWPIEYLAEALAEGIATGHEGQVQMPEFLFDPDEIDNLLAYLESVQDG
ncbi:MAG: cytochrome c [Inquilinus sp.]|nr:cytochrome c [Inquilinus sp.]